MPQRTLIPGALITLLLPLIAFPSDANAQSAAASAQAAKVKAFIADRGRGERAVVTLEMQDETKAKGYVWAAMEDSFTLIDAKTRKPVTILYGDVYKIDRGRSEWTKLLIFVGATFGVIAAVISIAVVAAGGV